MKKIISNFSISLFLFSILLGAKVKIGLAAGILPEPSGNSKCDSQNGCGDYSLDDFMRLAINVSDWILGIVGSAALLMFVYGGFMFILSGGSSERVEKGKKIIIGSVIGLVLVFTSYLIIKFVAASLGIDSGWGTLK